MKAIFLDIDGTLRSHQTGIPTSAKKAIELAQAAGHKVFVNSGRPRCMVEEPDIMSLGLDGMICGCGSQVILDGKLLCDYQVSPEESRRIVTQLRSRGVDCNLEGPDCLFFDRANPANQKAWNEMFTIFKGKVQVLEEELPDGFVFTKFMTHCNDYDLLREIVGETMEVLPDPHGAEVVQKCCNKGTGIDLVVKTLGIELEDCYAIGDSNNDLGMLCHVKHSIAMGNAMPDILPYCEYQTTSLEKDGIYNAFRHYGLI